MRYFSIFFLNPTEAATEGVDELRSMVLLMEELLWKGGKIENPVHRVGGHFLLWNSDPRPEGMNVIYSQDKLHATAGHDPL
ncbi:MAG: hypothetical protein V7700_10535 [Halioglobus sp.]